MRELPNSTARRFPFYLLLTLLLYFICIFYLPRYTLPEFSFVSSLASLPFSSCCHRTTTSLYRIFLLFLPWLPCHFCLIVIKQQQHLAGFFFSFFPGQHFAGFSFCFFPGILAIFILLSSNNKQKNLILMAAKKKNTCEYLSRRHKNYIRILGEAAGKTHIFAHFLNLRLPLGIIESIT